MIFGHNSNVEVAGQVYHVQTEDRGPGSALIDTTVYSRGRVLHRLTNNYFDLLPLDPEKEAALKIRLDRQHQAVAEEIRSGVLRLAQPAEVNPGLPAAAKPPHVGASTVPVQATPLTVELLNAKNWLSGKRANLQVAVHHQGGTGGLSGARVIARVEGAAPPNEFSTDTAANGHAKLEFDMPRIVEPEVALLIEATHQQSKGRVRFQLRAKPKVPSVG